MVSVVLSSKFAPVSIENVGSCSVGFRDYLMPLADKACGTCYSQAPCYEYALL